MRYESSVTAISWIPSEAISGMPRLPFELGIGHYDEPPPDRLEEGDLERLRDKDRFREANHLKAWIEVEDKAIVGYGHEGGGLVGSTTFRLGFKVVVPGVAFDVLRPEPEVRSNSVRFVQTVGGRAGFPAAPREGQAVLPHPLGYGVDDARCDDRARRHLFPRGRRRGPSRGTGSTTRTGTSSRSRARSTSRRGIARRTATTRRGATRTPMRS